MPRATNRPSKNSTPSRGKYQHLVEYFTTRIRDGRLASGERLPTFVELQEQFGVTANTVNRALIDLEQKKLVVREPRRGVYVAATRPALVISASGAAKSHLIGLAGFSFQLSEQSSYWASVLQGVREAAGKLGQQILLLPENAPIGWEKADGLILCDWSQREIPRFVPPQLPCVSLLVPSSLTSSVYFDERDASRRVAEHLTNLGHTKIAYLGGIDPSSSIMRLAGFHDALKQAGVRSSAKRERAISGANYFGEHYVEAGRKAMRRWLREDWEKLGCTALMCHNDEIAVGAMEALSEAGIEVPADVSVAGFDGLEIGNGANPPLTTVELPLRQAGVTAIELLLRRIEAADGFIEHQVLPAQLCVRESTSALQGISGRD